MEAVTILKHQEIEMWIALTAQGWLGPYRTKKEALDDVTGLGYRLAPVAEWSTTKQQLEKER